MRIHLLAGPVVLALAAGSVAQAASNWADKPDAVTDPAYAASRALCQAAKTVKIPAPDAGAKPAAASCSSEALYYGIGMPADPAAARACAMRERQVDASGEAAWAGDAMLMTMFANGKGAPRDLDVATALACTLDGAPEEMDGRVKHLAALRAKGPGDTDFSFCDDVTSGFYQGFCAGHDSRIAAVARTAALDRLASALTGADRSAFDSTRTAAEAFATARGENEVDLAGTGRGAFELEAEDAARDDLLDLLQRLAAARLPVATPARAEAQDKALNATYVAVMKLADPQWGTPTKDGIRATQRIWLAYRDAAMAFAAGTYGAPAGDAVKAWLSARRTSQLKGFLT